MLSCLTYLKKFILYQQIIWKGSNIQENENVFYRYVNLDTGNDCYFHIGPFNGLQSKYKKKHHFWTETGLTTHPLQIDQMLVIHMHYKINY